MAEAYWLSLAALAALLGMAWLALSLDVHWRQVVRVKYVAPAAVPGFSLRFAGALSLSAALVFCLLADHVSMAVLAWVMLMASSAVVIAMTLTWQPQWLRLLAMPWAGSVAPNGR